MMIEQGNRRKLLIKIFIYATILALLVDCLGLYILDISMSPCIGKMNVVRITSTDVFLQFDKGVLANVWRYILHFVGAAIFAATAGFFILSSVLVRDLMLVSFLIAPVLAILSQIPRFAFLLGFYDWLVPLHASVACQVVAIFSPLVFTYAWLNIMAVALHSYVVHYHPELMRPRS